MSALLTPERSASLADAIELKYRSVFIGIIWDRSLGDSQPFSKFAAFDERHHPFENNVKCIKPFAQGVIQFGGWSA